MIGLFGAVFVEKAKWCNVVEVFVQSVSNVVVNHAFT